jgi:hypothetical protein
MHFKEFILQDACASAVKKETANNTVRGNIFNVFFGQSGSRIITRIDYYTYTRRKKRKKKERKEG